MAIRVLMIDDDPVHLELSEQFLKRQSSEYEIVPVETSEEAMNLLFEDQFDAAVCDIDLGQQQPTGLDILRQVRVSEIDIPVIIFTGKSREEIAIQALNLGADYYIRKSSSKIEGLYAELSHYILTAVKKRRTERALVESEQRLRESEAKLAEAQRIAHIGHWDWNILEDNIVWSDEIYRIFGLAPQEFEATYEAFLNSVHKDDREFVRESVDKAIHEKQNYSIDHRVLHRDGKVRVVHELGEVTYDDEGRAVRMMGIVQDITERIQQETALSANEEMFRTIFEESPICIELFDSDGILVGANMAALELFGVSALEQFIGFDLFGDPNTPEFVKDNLRRGEMAMTEYRFDFSKVKVHDLYKTSKSGIMHIDCVYSPIKYGKEEDLQGFIIHVQNITDRVLAEQALMESRESYKELYNNALVGLFRVRISDGMILECNDQFAKKLGYEKKGLIIDETNSIKSILLQQKEWEELKNELREHQRIVTELPVSRRDGERIWMRFSLSHWPDRGYIEGVIVDITEQHEALEMLKKQKEELSEFAHSMSHDLKNIFQNMLGFIELTQEEQNYSHLKRLKSLLNETGEMLDHSVALADAGLVIEETVNVELTPLVKEVADSIIPENVYYSQEELPMVSADQRKVAQIFRNLFDNAIQHGQPRSIDVSVSKTEMVYRIKISNDGKAIPETQRSKIFQRGFTTSKSGQGYGLAIVKHLVEAHGWTIKLLNERKTTFEIEIPIL